MAVPTENRNALLGEDDTTRLSGSQGCDSNPAEAQQGRVTSGRAIVVGDSIVRGADRRFCGSRRDSRMGTVVEQRDLVQVHGSLKVESQVGKVV